MFKLILAVSALTFPIALAEPAFSQQVGVVAIVNDHPVTGFDIDQRIRLLQILGQSNVGQQGRKKIANGLINDYIKIDEAKRNKLDPSEKELDERMKQMAQGMKTDEAGLKSKLAAQGLSMSALRQFAAAQISFSRLLGVKYREKVSVDPGEVDKKFAEVKADIQGKVAKIESDPRRQPVKVIKLTEINFPAEGNDPQLLQSRAVEANAVASKINSCGNLRGAAAGVFNVQIGKTIEADTRKLPAPMRSAIEAKGVGHAIGPMRYKGGIQLLAYCGSRMIVPPKLNVQYPSRQQIENMALNQKYDQVEAKYMVQMRKTAIIEYKDQSYAE